MKARLCAVCSTPANKFVDFLPEMGIYKRKEESKKTIKQELNQESVQEKKKTRTRPRKRARKQERKQESDQEKKKKSSCFLVFLLSCFLLEIPTSEVMCHLVFLASFLNFKQFSSTFYPLKPISFIIKVELYQRRREGNKRVLSLFQ